MKRLLDVTIAAALIVLPFIGAAGAALGQWIPAPPASPAAQSSPVNHARSLDPESRRLDFERKWFQAKKADGSMSPQEALAQKLSNPTQNNVSGQNVQAHGTPSRSN